MGNSLFKMRLQNTNYFVHSLSFSCFPPPSPNQAHQIVPLLQGSPIQTVKLNSWLLLHFIVLSLKFWETKNPSIRASSKQNVFDTFYKKGHLLEWHGLASRERIEPFLCHLEEPSFWFSFFVGGGFWLVGWLFPRSSFWIIPLLSIALIWVNDMCMPLPVCFHHLGCISKSKRRVCSFTGGCWGRRACSVLLELLMCCMRLAGFHFQLTVM